MLDRRRLILGAGAIAPAVILTPCLLMPVRSILAVRTEPTQEMLADYIADVIEHMSNKHLPGQFKARLSLAQAAEVNRYFALPPWSHPTTKNMLTAKGIWS